jgi:hypothetical protein
MARKIPSLGRFLGVRALYAMAYGEISSSLYYALPRVRVRKLKS